MPEVENLQRAPAALATDGFQRRQRGKIPSVVGSLIRGKLGEYAGATGSKLLGLRLNRGRDPVIINILRSVVAKK
jgi:phage tail tape-measure protein